MRPLDHTDRPTRTRTEHDLLGDREVPEQALYGVHTLRAVENFAVSGIPLGARPLLVQALAAVKQAAATANRDLGLISAEQADAIVTACTEIRDGRWHDHFVVDVVQGGAGTSTNMNANEVIANRGLELLGHRRGDYRRLHPLEHVNRSQSTNDAYPTALKIALALSVDTLCAAMRRLAAEFAARATDFADLLKIGRTQLQDAVPMTLGQEFAAFAVMIEEDADRLEETKALIAEINLGGTAIGTGITTHPEYAARACAALRDLVGLPLRTAANLVEATQDVGAFVQVSGVLKRTAVKLSKICNDLRLLSSGPRAGLGEIVLPAVQAGSSIMPGKVNPVIPELVNQIAFQVIGNDVTVSLAAEGGQLQLNAFEPIIAESLHESVAHLTAGCDTLRERCVAGITADVAVLTETVERSISLVTALSPYIGYETATEVAHEALESGRSVTDVVLDRTELTAERLAEIIAPSRLVAPAPTGHISA
ncbi:aspartate ammonia-lyase [Pseudonocardia halophobica]|uniref:aspartate ammonia-lyase n=1 Tax=Pseudonocardia halophobica TaxID=29401 RepID=UPI003D926D9B